MTTQRANRPPLSVVSNLLIATFSIAYGLVLQALPLMLFKDRANYLNYAQDSANILNRYAESGLLTVLANEPVWLTLNITLAQFLSAEAILQSVIFIGASLFSYVFLRADPKNAIWLILFVLTPQILKNFITHLRQGVGIAVFFAGYIMHGKYRRWVVMGLAPFIHASFFFVLPFVIVPHMLERMRLAIDVRLTVMSLLALVASLSIGIVAALVGARQVDAYDFAMTSVSGLGFVFWSAVFFIFLLEGRGFLQQRQSAASVLLFYLLSYFFIEVTARIFESGLPLVLLAGLHLTGWRKWGFLSSYLAYSLIQWVLNLSSPTPF